MKSTFLRSAAIAVFLNALLMGAAQGQYSLVGKSAPDFTLPLLAGGEFQLSELEGKNVVLLAFWATWDMYSRQAMPAIVELSNEYKAQGVRVLAVNQGEDEPKIRSYLDGAQIDIEVPVDRQRQVFGLYGVRGVPTMMIVDREGIVRHVHEGSQNLKAQLKNTLDLILAETPAPVLPPTLVTPALGGQDFAVTVTTVLGRHYRLEYKSSLGDASWIALPPVPGNGGDQVLSDPLASGPHRVYRVRID